MSLETKEDNISTCEAGTATTYLNENQSSHLSVVRDSIRIYRVFFKYIFSSLSSSLVDIVALTVLISLFSGLSLGTATLVSTLACAISSVVNFTLNHKAVFKQGQLNNAIKYFTLVVVQIALLSLLVTVLGNVLMMLPISVVKILVDGTLFFVNYFVQKRLIFSRGGNEDQ